LPYTDDKRLIEFGIGLTDLVKRATRQASELERQEIAEGRILLAQKLDEYAPRVVAFNGKETYEKFAQRPCKLGLQTEKLYGARVFVLPSTGTPDSMERGIRLRYFRDLARVLSSLPD
jgi:mismatch-specific thymine-DNA glycosylase